MENLAGRSNYTTAAGVWRRRSSRYSWEELAFAEDDAAGSFWPPRSYTCSFCSREFRSAQALGGHMNVHRRDRARLKQAADHRNHHDESESKRAASCYTLDFSPKPKKPERSCVNFDLASSSSSASLSSRVLSLSRKEGTVQEASLFPPSFSSSPPPPRVLEYSKNVKKLLFESLILEGDKRGKSERDVSESGCRGKLGLVNNNDLSVSLNLVMHRSLPVPYGGRGEEGEIDKVCKRRRRDESMLQPFSHPSLSCKNDIVARSNEEIRQRANPLEDLDLELRLGADPPKVN